MTAYNPFTATAATSSQPATDAQKIAATLAAIKQNNATAARALLNSYNSSMQLVNASRYTLADGSQLSADAIYAALDAAAATDPTVPTSVVEKQIAVMVKTLVNTITPGTITDAIPQGTLTLPGEGE